jgi:hypothetical protein
MKSLIKGYGGEKNGWDSLHYAMKTYGGIDIEIHVFLTSH